MLTVEVEGIPNLRIDARIRLTALKTMAKVAEASILDNIRRQKTISGSRIKRNPMGRDSKGRLTSGERKRRAGKPLLSLIDNRQHFSKGRSQSFAPKFHTRKGGGFSISAATPQIDVVMKSVMKKGYVGWFGINREARAAMQALAKRDLLKTVKAAIRG